MFVRGCEKFLPAFALTVLPGPAWVLLSKKYILFPGALYVSFVFQRNNFCKVHTNTCLVFELTATATDELLQSS